MQCLRMLALETARCLKIEVKANTKVHDFVCSRIACVRGKDTPVRYISKRGKKCILHASIFETLESFETEHFFLSQAFLPPVL